MKKSLVCLMMASLLAGCGDKEAAEAAGVKSAREVLNEGNPKVLRVRLEDKYGASGPEMRFYDSDGDGKTVEHYVVLHMQGAFTPFGVQEDLLRPGAEPQFDPTDGKGIRRQMTAEEREKIDAKYQTLLQDFRE